MMTHNYYISYGRSLKYTKVTVSGYRDILSIGAFQEVNTKTALKIAKKGGSYAPYDFIYRVNTEGEYDHFFDMALSFSKLMGDEETVMPSCTGQKENLRDFYDSIGWDYKTKKLNGLTMNQHIKRAMDERKN